MTFEISYYTFQGEALTASQEEELKAGILSFSPNLLVESPDNFVNVIKEILRNRYYGSAE